MMPILTFNGTISDDRTVIPLLIVGLFLLVGCEGPRAPAKTPMSFQSAVAVHGLPQFEATAVVLEDTVTMRFINLDYVTPATNGRTATDKYLVFCDQRSTDFLRSGVIHIGIGVSNREGKYTCFTETGVVGMKYGEDGLLHEELKVARPQEVILQVVLQPSPDTKDD